MIDILGKRYFWFALSFLVIVPGLVVMAIWGLPLAIDFTGGALLEIEMASGILPQPAEIVALLTELEIHDSIIQTTARNSMIIRTSPLDEVLHAKVLAALEDTFHTEITVLRYDNIGPTIGREVAGRAGLAVGAAALGVVAFIALAFRKIPNSFRYGICAIIALAHDILVVVSISAVGGKFWGWQVDALFLTALLTVIGFSVQDKIVVFDRIRENSALYKKITFEQLANHSIVQTLQRSINTQLMTAEFLLLALAIFGGVTLREFSIILLIGLFCGTYSSIFIAAPILVVWENKEWRYWFSRKKSQVKIQ